MSGKGSKPRPFSVSNEEYANRWDAIFGRDVPKEPEPTEEELLEAEDADKVCPECRSGLTPKLLYSRFNEELQVACHHYCYKCLDCGFVGECWDVLD